MKKQINMLIGSTETFSLEHRLLNFAFLLAIFLTFIAVVIDILLERNWTFWLVPKFVWLFLFYQSRYKGYFKIPAIITFSFLTFVCYPYWWIYNAGSQGVFIFYVVLLIAMIATVLDGLSRYLMVLSMIIVTVVLIAVEYYYPGIMVQYDSTAKRYLDIAINLPIGLFIISSLLIFFSTVYKKEKERSENYARSIEEHYQQQLYYMENLEKLNYRLKSERHDFNNHLGVIFGLAEDKEFDNVINYTRELVASAEEYQNIVNIPYPTLRAMLNYKLAAVGEEEINLKQKINIPEGLKLAEYDLTIILGNLLDNAIEACYKIEGENRYIGLSILYKPDYLVMSVENPINEEQVFENGKYQTTKQDQDNHGFGLKNIEHLVKKHDGFMKIVAEENVFKVDIAVVVEMTG